jgi:hypothetical protein
MQVDRLQQRVAGDTPAVTAQRFIQAAEVARTAQLQGHHRTAPANS